MFAELWFNVNRSMAPRTHGYAGKQRKLEYGSFYNAHSRCNNPNNSAYKYYGGRGIEFRFNNFEQFIAYIGDRPTPKHTLDRINTDGHYEPGNVRWATRLEQQNNLRFNTRLTLDGVTRTLPEWARRLPISRLGIINRMKKGWCDRCALTRPTIPGVKQICQC
jgi:hypothetical protein